MRPLEAAKTVSLLASFVDKVRVYVAADQVPEYINALKGTIADVIPSRAGCGQNVAKMCEAAIGTTANKNQQGAT